MLKNSDLIERALYKIIIIRIAFFLLLGYSLFTELEQQCFLTRLCTIFRRELCKMLIQVDLMLPQAGLNQAACGSIKSRWINRLCKSRLKNAKSSFNQCAGFPI
jgi:hypothetical protein